MNESPEKKPDNPFVQVALCSGGASAGIAFICMFSPLHALPDDGGWAFAAMVSAPAF